MATDATPIAATGIGITTGLIRVGRPIPIGGTITAWAMVLEILGHRIAFTVVPALKVTPDAPVPGVAMGAGTRRRFLPVTATDIAVGAAVLRLSHPTATTDLTQVRREPDRRLLGRETRLN